MFSIASLGGELPLDSNVTPLGFTAADGALDLPPDLSKLGGVLVYKEGFVLAWSSALQQATLHELTLRPAAVSRLRVVKRDGSPVRGYVIGLATPRLASCDAPATSSGTRVLKLRGKSEVAFFGATDVEGELTVSGLAPGRYVLRYNLTGKLLAVSNPMDPQVLDFPIDHTIEVEEPYGAAVRFVGDEALFVRKASSPFRFTAVADGRRAQSNGVVELERLFPEAHVRVGLLRDPSETILAMRVFGRTGGWSVVNAQLRPLSAITSPEFVQLQAGPTDRCAPVVVKVLNPDGAALVGPGIFWHTWHGEQELALPIAPNETILLPVGRFVIRSELPRGALEPVEGDLAPATAVREFVVRLRKQVCRIRINIFDPDGNRTAKAQLRAGKKLMFLANGSGELWLTDSPVHLKVMGTGLPVYETTAVLGQGRMEGGVEVFDIRLPETGR